MGRSILGLYKLALLFIFDIYMYSNGPMGGPLLYPTLLKNNCQFELRIPESAFGISKCGNSVLWVVLMVVLQSLQFGQLQHFGDV